MALPSAYKEVKYIESSGTQYISTNIVPSNTKGIYIKLSSQDITTDLLYVGSRKETDTRFWIGNSTNSSGNLYLGWNTNDRGVISVNTIFEAKLNYLNSREKEVNGTVVASNLGTLSSSNNIPITIFAGNENGTIITPSSIKLYSCKISDGSNIVNDFIPCYRESDNKPGLYDLVNDVFYTNAGTGEFIAGPEEGKLPSAYKEVEWIQNSGTQRINTGLYPSSNMTVQMKFINTAYGGMNLFGYNNAETDSFRFFRANNTTYLDYGSGSNYNRISGTYITSTSDIYEVEFGNRYVKDIPTDTIKFSGTEVSFGEKSINAYIFGNKDNTPDYMKLYYCKIYVSGTLVRDYVPCYRKSDNVTGMYDLVNDQFYTNAGTGTFIRGPIKDKGIPDDYTLVECIESSGTQYIDTGFKPSNKTKVINKGYILDAYMYGVGLAGSYYSIALYNGDGTHYRGRCRSSSSGNSTVDSSVACNTTSHIFECSQIDGLYIDGTQIGTFTQYTYTESYNMYLFARNNYRDNIADGKSNCRMYYCKIYDDGTLYRDMVPVIRNSDNKPGMYDIVTDTFYTNAGTGEFNYKKYPESGQIQKIYIGVDQVRPGLSEHTVVYDDIPFKTEYTIAKSGYNIKQIILEWSAHYSLTSWQINQIFLTSPSNSNLRLRTDGQLGGTYGYDYGEGIGKYVGQTFDVNSSANHYSVFASPNSSYAGTYDNAGYVTITKDTVDYKIGQTYGTWLWTGTTTLSTQLKGYMETLLNSDDIFCKRNTWDSNDLFTYYKVTVTYEPV